jgi:hypothetical protein
MKDVMEEAVLSRAIYHEASPDRKNVENRWRQAGKCITEMQLEWECGRQQRKPSVADREQGPTM